MQRVLGGLLVPCNNIMALYFHYVYVYLFSRAITDTLLIARFLIHDFYKPLRISVWEFPRVINCRYKIIDFILPFFKVWRPNTQNNPCAFPGDVSSEGPAHDGHNTLIYKVLHSVGSFEFPLIVKLKIVSD